MRDIKVKVHPSKSNLKKEDQLAWKIAEIASDKAKIEKEVVDMVINRIIDNSSVAIASFNRKPVISAREMALAHPKKMVQLFLESIQRKNLIVNGQLGQMELRLEN